MIFNPDLTKKVGEVLFSRTIKKLVDPTLLFNSMPLNNSMFQKYFSLH